MKFNISFIRVQIPKVEKIECDTWTVENGVLLCVKDSENIAGFSSWLSITPVKD